jgi:hypothetical protein
MIKNNLVVIGGSDAGVSASLRAKELSPDTEVTMLLADRYPNFSICGLPFYLSGEVSDWNTLAHRTADEIKKKGYSCFLIILSRQSSRIGNRFLPPMRMAAARLFPTTGWL